MIEARLFINASFDLISFPACVDTYKYNLALKNIRNLELQPYPIILNRDRSVPMFSSQFETTIEY